MSSFFTLICMLKNEPFIDYEVNSETCVIKAKSKFLAGFGCYFDVDRKIFIWIQIQEAKTLVFRILSTADRRPILDGIRKLVVYSRKKNVMFVPFTQSQIMVF